MRDHLALAARNRDPKIAANAERQLTPPEFPERYRYLWGWFMELQSHRGDGMSGPARLTWPDVDAWARCMRHAPSPWEYRVLGRLDEAFLTVVQESR